MSAQTLTSISAARLEQSTSLISADVSARSVDDSFDTPRSDDPESTMTEEGPQDLSAEEEDSAHMTDSSAESELALLGRPLTPARTEADDSGYKSLARRLPSL